MAKRSAFPRLDKDLYRTIDGRAVAALSPFLINGTKYAEPCYGYGDLESWLDLDGQVECNFRSDIEPRFTYVIKKDALDLTSTDLSSCDSIITNPPWTRKLLHSMIERFSQLKPTWLLFDSNWANTKQSSHYIRELCTDIVSVGRLFWIPDTKVQGKDDAAWYHFDINKYTTTRFHGR